MKRTPELDLKLRRAPAPATVRVASHGSADPLTGHRGDGGGAVVAVAGPATLLARLTHGPDGAVVRGQLTSLDQERVHGAIVHARGSEGAALAAADGLGEFGVRGWRGRLVAIDVELEDGTWSVPWPDEGS